ncbi:DMT family transporter [Oceanirhabdus sp. W0125-5]|uniref:DMT family transporter n=1 Tax=Oceanirhabdus sp. W0125-5 TaxID=2999116 RepID=UPI0022F2D944|nr:DMT family transporter [Oceanirhabdus sp. W0125-5]WBW94683.1 DMT family transporter [Oceanirhabdus sp. W0125-5]
MRINKCYLLMILAAFFWSGAFIAGKLSTPFISPFTLTFLRFSIASFLLFLFIKFKEKTLYKPKKEDIPIFLFTGVIGMFGYHILFFYSLRYTTAINSSIIGSTNPIITTILGIFFLRDKLSIKQILGIFISIFGIILTITNGNLSSFNVFDFNIGDIYMILAVIMWASYSVFSKKVCHRYKPIHLTFYSFLVCTVFLIPFVLYERPWHMIVTAPISTYLAILYMSIFASIIGYLIQQISIKEIGASSTNIFINLVPVFSMILSTLILHEELTIVKIISASIIILGVYISQKSSLTVLKE